MPDKVRCPSCDAEIDVASVLAAQVRGELQRQFEAQTRTKAKELAEREEALNHQQEKLILQQSEIDKELKKRLEAAFAEREETLGQRDLELIARQKRLDGEVEIRLEKERAALQAAAMENAKKAAAGQLGDLADQLTQVQDKLAEAQATEVNLRKERRELEQQRQELELTVNRTLDEERQKIREQATKDALAQHSLRDADKDMIINDLKTEIAALQRKSEQGSQQLQGEVFELELEKALALQFVQDEIVPVAKGVHGADILHQVLDGMGRGCGSILWELKRTKNWSHGWLPKLREDQREAKAQIAILVSEVTPPDLPHFGLRDGVWVTKFPHAIGLATALRSGLIEIAKTATSLEGRQDKMSLVYNYLSSVEFKNRVEGIVEAFVTMRQDLESEKRSMQRHWSKREKQLEQAVANTSGLYGELSGIMGRSLPEMKQLELTSGEE